MSLKNSHAHHVVREAQRSLKDKSRSWAGEGRVPGSREQLSSYSNRNLHLTTWNNGSCLRNSQAGSSVVWCGVMWHAGIWCVWYSRVQCGALCYAVLCRAVVWHGCYAMVDMVW